jgi:hypothetical protein
MFFVDLPGSVELGITAAIVALVFAVVKFVAARIPWLGGFLAQYANEVALAVSAAFILWLENALPSAYPDIAVLALQLILAVLAAIGVIEKFLARRGVKGFMK